MEIRQLHAFGCELVEMGRLDQSIVIGTDAIPTLLVRHDEKDVWPVQVSVGQNISANHHDTDCLENFAAVTLHFHVDLDADRHFDVRCGLS